MRADMHVVANLYLVVQTHVFFQHRVFQRAAVDAGIGADFAVIANQHATQLRHLDPAPGIHGQAEAVGTQYGTWMDAYTFAKPHPGNERDPGDQFAAVTYLAVFTDHATRADHTAITDLAVGANDNERGDMRSW